jgi:hypothetical protein
VVEQFLGDYFPDPDTFQVIELLFDLGCDDAAEKWNRDALSLINRLSNLDTVVTFVTTHTDPDRGDLWLGKDELGEDCSAAVTDVSTGLCHHFSN